MGTRGFKLDYNDTYTLGNGEVLYRIIAEGNKTKADGTKGGYVSKSFMMDSSSWVYEGCVINGVVSVVNQSELKDCDIMSLGRRKNIVISGSKLNLAYISTELSENILIKDSVLVSSSWDRAGFRFDASNTIIDNCVLDSLELSDVSFIGQFCILKDSYIVDTKFTGNVTQFKNLTISNSDFYCGTVALLADYISFISLSDINVEKGGEVNIYDKEGYVVACNYKSGEGHERVSY